MKTFSNFVTRKDRTGCKFGENLLTARPTAPRPKMATVDPYSTLAVFHAAPTPADQITMTIIRSREQIR